MMSITRHMVAAVAATLVAGLVAPVGSGMTQAQADPRPDRTSPITVTMLRGPDGEPLASPGEPLQSPKVLDERGQVAAQTQPGNGFGDVVLWHRDATTPISPDGVTAYPRDISETGHVVGTVSDNGTRPFSWRDGEWRYLSVPDGARGEAEAVNDRGQIAGSHIRGASPENPHVEGRVVVWWGDHVVEAPLTITDTQFAVVDINDRGQVLFNVTDARGATSKSAYIWQVGGGITDLGDLGGDAPSTEAVALNNRGQVVGRSETGEPGEHHGFLWEDGEMTDLGTFGGPWSYATAINDRGQVVGRSDTGEPGEEHGFLWEDGEVTDLGDLSGFWDEVTAINDRGQVVGTRDTASEPNGSRAFLWEDGEMTDLGALLDDAPPDAAQRVINAVDINERGQIFGNVVTSFEPFAVTNEAVLWTLPRRR
jgi:probable HAF family extracellular repeat protein